MTGSKTKKSSQRLNVRPMVIKFSFPVEDGVDVSQPVLPNDWRVKVAVDSLVSLPTLPVIMDSNVIGKPTPVSKNHLNEH